MRESNVFSVYLENTKKYNKKIILATKHDPLKEQTVSVLKRDEESTFKYILLPDGILRQKPDGAPNGVRQRGLLTVVPNFSSNIGSIIIYQSLGSPNMGSITNYQSLAWILYSRISVVFQNEFSSNGRAGLMLFLSLFAIGQESVCTQ